MGHNGTNEAIKKHLNARAPSIICFERGAGPRFYSPFGNLDRSSTVDQKSQSKAET
jgi:hypothetical protein